VVRGQKIKILALFTPLASGLYQERTRGHEASELRTALLLFPRTDPRSWTLDYGRVFALPLFRRMVFSSSSSEITFLLSEEL